MNVWGNLTKYVHGNLFEVVLGQATKIAVGGLIETKAVPLPPTAIGSVPAYVPAFQEYIKSFKRSMTQQSGQSGNSSASSDSYSSISCRPCRDPLFIIRAKRILHCCRGCGIPTRCNFNVDN